MQNEDPDEIVENITSQDPNYVLKNEPKFLKGFQNGYNFTKNLAERCIAKHRGNLRVVISRPSVVGPCYRDPVPGHIDSLQAMPAYGFPLAMGFSTEFYCHDGIVSAVPGDFTANGIIVHSVYAARTAKPELNIFHLCTGSFNDKKEAGGS